MCAVNGAFAYAPSAASPEEGEIIRCRDYMATRGMDGEGLWFSADRRVAFGHRRLSIIDLSEAGRQPMLSADGRLAVVFNGEIYNYRELRRELEADGVVFRTASDTEVLLQLYARNGETMLNKLRGMFAFAIWDETRAGLLLARDPYGIKPLYVSHKGGVVRFASQVKALLASGGVSREADPAGSVGFLLWGAVPEPFTLYRDVSSLPAGSYQWIDRYGPRDAQAYVELPAILSAAHSSPLLDVGARAGAIREAVLDSVQQHLVADVELGVFLSGGIDSGALLGLMRDAGHRRTKGVTLRFEEFVGGAGDESVLAMGTARLYEAEHHVRTVTETEFNNDLPAILEAMDQPSIDGVNTWFASKAASELGLKVALAGVGGDELLGGYPSFQDVPRWVRWLRWPSRVRGLPIAARSFIRALISLNPSLSPKLANMLTYGGSFEGAYLLRRGLFLPDELDALCNPSTLQDGLERVAVMSTLRRSLTPDPGSDHGRVTALESLNYLKNQLLRDADWAGMAHGLEIRSPLVDIELLRRLAGIIPQLTPGEGKRALARMPSRPLPNQVLERAITGFLVPTREWGPGPTKARSDGHASRARAAEILNKQAIGATS